MWRNEVNAKKRERTRQQALELRQMQKMFLLKAMAEGGGKTGTRSHILFHLLEAIILSQELQCRQGNGNYHSDYI